MTAGHREVPHTADLRIEAWAPTAEECLAEAGRALVDAFADVSGAPRERTAVRGLAGGNEEALLALLDEIIYVLDAAGEVPVDVEVSRDRQLSLHLTAFANAVQVGATPKAATLQDLEFTADGGLHRCAATVDI